MSVYGCAYVDRYTCVRGEQSSLGEQPAQNALHPRPANILRPCLRTLTRPFCLGDARGINSAHGTWGRAVTLESSRSLCPNRGQKQTGLHRGSSQSTTDDNYKQSATDTTVSPPAPETPTRSNGDQQFLQLLHAGHRETQSLWDPAQFLTNFRGRFCFSPILWIGKPRLGD